MTRTMRAVVAPVAGGPEVLEIVQRPVPSPGPGEILIRVAGAGVNRPDVMQRTGALPQPTDAPDIFGLEVAGEIVETGPDVDGSLIGTQAMALLKGGGYAEYAIAKAAHALPIPDRLSLFEAAALPEGLFTIWHNLFDRGRLTPGERVLIQGGASGIGTLALQLALANDAEVIVTAGGTEKCARLEAMGVHAIDYRSADVPAEVMRLTRGRGVDVVLDILGGKTVNNHLACMAPGGRHIGLSFMTGVIAPIDLSLLMRKGLWLSSSTLRPKSDAEKAAIGEQVKSRLLPLLGPHKVRPVLSEVMPLSAVISAHRLLESSRNIGKIVLDCSENSP